jgi:serine protease Do
MRMNIDTMLFMGLALTSGLGTAAPAVPQSRPAAVAAAAAGLPNLSDIAERAVQASVNISSTQQVRVDPFFQLFYGAGPFQPQTSLGSGVIVSADGYILTNSHVVGNARAEIKVTLPGKGDLPATLVGIDVVSDLAVVKVNASGLAPLPWGDSSKLRIAEWVLAIGNPFAFNQTVTLGIVSAVNRHDPQLASYGDMIQTDAAINPGNSGGALINSRGELIGINTMIYSETGGYQGLGFAIPANLAQQVMNELITSKNHEIVRGAIGIESFVQDVDPADAEQAGLGRIRCLLITGIASRNAPAYRAGLQRGDVITKVNGKDVGDSNQFQRLVHDAKVGTVLTIEVVRGGRRLIADVAVEKLTAGRLP